MTEHRTPQLAKEWCANYQTGGICLGIRFKFYEDGTVKQWLDPNTTGKPCTLPSKTCDYFDKYAKKASSIPQKLRPKRKWELNQTTARLK